MKKILSSILVFVLILAFSLPIKSDAAQVFSDVPTSHTNYDDINYLLNKDVVEKSSKFGVSEIVTREEVAVMVAKAVGLDGKQRSTKFKDVPQSSKNSGYIQSAAEAGIINGYDDGTFKPNAKVTRGHMAAFIARAFDLPTGSKTFKDVPVGHTAYDAVKKLAVAGITTGYNDGTFKPQENLSRAHIAAFVARAMRYSEGNKVATPESPAKEQDKEAVKDPIKEPEKGSEKEPEKESFKNCTELRKVYPDGVSSDHPAYDKKHDRDGDGWACEK